MLAKLFILNMQANYISVPNIFPLMVDLDPNLGGGLYVRAEEDRLILAWDHLRRGSHCTSANAPRGSTRSNHLDRQDRLVNSVGVRAVG